MFSAFEIDQDGLRLELVVQPAISYALVHNRVPVVRRVTLTNRSPLSAYDLALELSVVGPHGPIAPPWRVERTAPVPPEDVTPEAHTAKLEEQIDLWTPVIEDAGVTGS